MDDVLNYIRFCFIPVILRYRYFEGNHSCVGPPGHFYRSRIINFVFYALHSLHCF